MPDERYKPSILHGDCIERLLEVPDKSIQCIIIDPPYNIAKAEWDIIIDYIPWMTEVIKVLEKKLKDNGSFFMFHNDMEQIAELMISIKQNTKLVFRQMIVWNKRFNESKKKGYLDGYVVKECMHNWNKMAEYLFKYFLNTL
jgi:site-specific DNA-methyltransferase (adenine-specific)